MKRLFLHFLRIFAKIFRVFFSIVGGAGIVLGLLCLIFGLVSYFVGAGDIEFVQSGLGGIVVGTLFSLVFSMFRRIEMWADTKIRTEFGDGATGRGCLVGIVVFFLFLGVVGWFSSAPRMVQPTVSNSNDFEQTEDIPTPEEMPEDETLYQDSGFVFPNSDTELIGRREIENLSDHDLMYAINELYARHGYIFRNQQICDYYEQFTWYRGEVPSDEFSTECFNQIESDNWSLLVSERDKRRTSG